MTRYVIFREDFQRNAWDQVGEVVAVSAAEAVKSFYTDQESRWGTYAAVEANQFLNFIELQQKVRIKPLIEVLDEVSA